MNIAIAGYGVEGRANYHYFAQDPTNELTIVDERSQIEDLPLGVNTRLGEGVFASLQGFDLVVRTASLSPKKIVTDGRVWSATEEFFSKCPAPIIGVTGTKGKGTTASMITSILRASGRTVWLVGNIGTASLSVLPEVKPDDIVVYELSSFQLWSMEQSPSIAVLLNIEPEHLDIHEDFADYVAAKANIRRFQSAGDICVYYGKSATVAEIIGMANAPALSYGLDGSDAYVKDDAFYVRDQYVCPLDVVQVRGAHNIENAVAAVAVAEHLGVAHEAIAAGLRNFHGLPHRLEYVTNINGVSYFNDSFSSSTPATIAAIDAFTEPEIIIIGGIDRGADFEQLADEIAQRQHIKEVITIGEIRHTLADLLRAAGSEAEVTVLDTRTMREVVAYAHSKAAEGDVVVLSPGAASFDMFHDFYDRGNQFRREVQAIAHKDDVFVFDTYAYDPATYEATFRYYFERGGQAGEPFIETVTFAPSTTHYDQQLLDAALRLAFLVAGTSYYKAYPTNHVRLPFTIDEWQANFLNHVYQEGLSQFAYENGLTRQDLALFVATGEAATSPRSMAGGGALALQSGGKDSLLTATLLNEAGRLYTPWYLSSSQHHPAVLDTLGQPLQTAVRSIDVERLSIEQQKGARNGHVPVTYIVQSYALIQAILLGDTTVLVSIAHEGEEPHATIGDLQVTHQWSKTWFAEQVYAEFVRRYISEDMTIGSPLRRFSELRVAELFADHVWERYGRGFSSCNRANYRQAKDNSQLTWCGECPKCANAYLLFAPFVPAGELQSLFGGQDLFVKPLLEETFKGLLDVDDVMKPFECIGETDELRQAYHLAQARGGYRAVPFDVPNSHFDYRTQYSSQQIAV
jgi:UDP-N-acetylmuramoylalanine--D-glutamate ligase